MGSNYGNSYNAQLSRLIQLHTFKVSRGGDEEGSVCNYCRGAGLRRSRNKYKLFSPALTCSNVPRLKPVCADPGIENGFEPFIADVGVSLDGSKERVPIRDLRDTGAKQSFTVESVSSYRDGGVFYFFDANPDTCSTPWDDPSGGGCANG